MTVELQYPIRGELYTRRNHQYYYMREHDGMRLGDTVEMLPIRRRGELITIVRIVKSNEPDSFVGVVRLPNRAGQNGYATEYGSMLGISDYDRNTHGCRFNRIEALYSGPCIECISNCKGEERCAFYREEI